MNATQRLHDAGQSLWLDNITRDLLTSASGTLPATATSQRLMKSEATEPTSGLSPAAMRRSTPRR